MAIEPRSDVPMTAEELQRELDDARPHQVVALPPGRIVGTFTIDRPVTLRGAGAEETVLEGDGNGPVLSIEATRGMVQVEDLTITQGRSSSGGGVSIDNGARVQLVGCLLSQNRCPSGRGGAVAVDVGELFIKECTLAWNSAHLGGALYVGGRARVEIVASIVADNLSLKGGGLAVEDGAEVDVWTCRFEQNTAEEEGHHLSAVGGVARTPHVLLSNSVLGPSSSQFGVPIANHPVFSAQLGIDNTVVARDLPVGQIIA